MSLFANGCSKAAPSLLGLSTRTGGLCQPGASWKSLVGVFLDQVYDTSTDPGGGPRPVQTSWR